VTVTDDQLMEVAMMVCLNFDIEKDGKHVLPSHLFEYMKDVLIFNGGSEGREHA